MPKYPFNRRLDGAQNQSERCGLEKNIFFHCLESNTGQPVAIPTDLFWLLGCGDVKPVRMLTAQKLLVWSRTCQFFSLLCSNKASFCKSLVYANIQRIKLIISVRKLSWIINISRNRITRVTDVNISKSVSKYNYHNSRHNPLSCLLFKTLNFGDWILSPSSGETYPVGCLRRQRLALGFNWVGSTWRRTQNSVSETLCF
jgi:hypothetical protein